MPESMEVTEISNISIDPKGQSVHILAKGPDGLPQLIEIEASCVERLSMTLPRMLQMMLRQRHSDQTLRYVFPLGGWEIESAHVPEMLVLKLATPDGFEASFAAPRAALARLSDDLTDSLSGGESAGLN